MNIWGRNIVIVYALFACGTLAFVGFAMTQRVDLTSEKYYEDALRHDELAAASFRGRLSGATIMHDGNELRIAMAPSVVVGSDVVVRFRRADDPGLDREVALQTRDSLGYSVSTEGLRPGAWKVEATWTSGSNNVQLHNSFRVSE